jgi:tight adherence protein C
MSLPAILTFIAVVLVGLLLCRPIFSEQYYAYGVRVRPRKKAKEDVVEAPKESALLGMCKAIGDAVMGISPLLADQRSRQLLMYANYRTSDHVSTYIGIKSIFTGAMAICFLLASPNNPMLLLFILPAAFVSWIMPNFFLAGRVRKRQDSIIRELPIVIDLLIVCAQAGLGLLSCLDKVGKEVEESCPNLSMELEQLMQDVKVFAKPIGTSLKDMGERCGVDELTSVATSLMSAESKGSDISYPLRMQSEALRERLKRKKEEEASKTPVKMVPVIMLFVMPLILCPMLGPAVITIMQALGPIFGGS